MNKLIFLLLSLLITVASVSACGADDSTQKEGDAVVFVNKNLETAVREAIGKKGGDILVSDLKNLRSLSTPEKRINDLAGLEYCTNLEELDLNNNKITDISLLASLKKLARLNLASNLLTDISPLKSLINLQYLELGN